MTLKQRLEADLLEAMRNSDTNLKNVIRMTLSSIKLNEIEKQAGADDSTVVSILQKEIKLRLETIEEAKKINRIDLLEQNRIEIQLLESYLPKQLSEIELIEIVKSTIKELNVSEMKDMGKVMKEVISKVAGKTSNDMISKSVRAFLGK